MTDDPAGGRPALASLPMYDWPEVAEETDAFWRAVRRALWELGVLAPAALSRGGEMRDVWRSPDLLVSQCCGAHLVHELDGLVRPVAAPAYSAPGCDGPTYRSALVARRGLGLRLADLSGRRAAVNGADSYSGHIVLKSLNVAPSLQILTGEHRASARTVAEGGADFAAIDAVCWAMIERFDPDVHAALEVVAMSDAAPAPPYIMRVAAGEGGVRVMAEAFAAALRDREGAEAARALMIQAIAPVGRRDYDPIAVRLAAAATG